jgi:hypothetical protein
MAVVCSQRCTTSQYISKNCNFEMPSVLGTSDVFATDANSWKGETPQTTSESERSIEWQVALTAHQPILEKLYFLTKLNNPNFTEPQVSVPCEQQPVTFLSFPRSTLILSSHLCLGLLNGAFPAGFFTNTYGLLFLPTRATYEVHLIHLDWTTNQEAQHDDFFTRFY